MGGLKLTAIKSLRWVGGPEGRSDLGVNKQTKLKSITSATISLLTSSQSREDEQQNLAVWATISSRYSLDTIYTYKLRIFNNTCFRV